MAGGGTSPSNDIETSASSNSMTGTCSNFPRDFSRLSLLSSGSTSSSSQDEHFTCLGHAEHSLFLMTKYLQAGKLCDIVLIAGENGRRISAHKLVLSAASEYFATMFMGSLSNNDEREITLFEIDGDVLQAVVNYCYTGTIEIREDNVETLLTTACLMLLHEVAEACSKFLAHQLHPSNCLGISIFAQHQSCISLLNDAKAYINKHFMQVLQNQEFTLLNVEQMSDLLSSDDLNVNSEEQVFNALVKWIQHDPSTRKQHFGRLLALIKIPFLNPAFISEKVEPAIENDPVCLKLILESMKWHLLPERRLQMISNRTVPRKATIGRLLIIGGITIDKNVTTIERYDPRSDEWIVIDHLSAKRLQFGIALMGTKLLVVGGRDGLKTLNSMDCLDLETDAWTQLSPMNTHRHGLGVAVLGDALYAVGGHDGWSYLSNVERWDATTRTWQYVAPMNIQRSSAGIAVLNEKIYVVGGRDGGSCLRSVECYSPHTNKWTLLAPLSHRNGCVGVAACNGYLYALGGQDAPANHPLASRYDTVERYDPSTNTWTIVSTLSSKRDAIACTLLGNKIYAVGGHDGNMYLKNVEAYDPVEDKWSVLKPLRSGRAGACAIVLNNSTKTKGECSE